MYTRIYGNEEKTVTVPENYDGNAFREEIPEPQAEEAPVEFKIQTEPEIPVMKNEDGDGVLAGLFKKLPLQSIFGNLGLKSLSSFKIGSEEILIIGIALFLFFSKGGDNELALMLLLLLFVR